MNALAAIALVFLALLVGGYAVAVLDRWATGLAAGVRPPGALTAPLRHAALLLVQQRTRTERPDAAALALAPAVYLALAAAGLSVVPFAPDLVVAELPTGIVLWGAAEALVIVAIFLHGWSWNSHLALIGAYRYVAVGLPVLLLSMFVLIGVALPAESLDVVAVVEAQRPLWNVVRQPLGLPLFLVVGLALAFWGPLDFADSSDLAGGTSVEASSTARLAFAAARAAMLAAFALMAATAFLGGYLGPVLPGPVWLGLKALAVLVVLTLAGAFLPRLSTERFVQLAWLVLLPIAFVDLAWAGLEALP